MNNLGVYKMRQLSVWIAVIFSLTSPALYAEITVINENQHIAIVADNDSTGDGNINMYSSGNLAMTINDSVTDINYGLNVDGATDLNSTLTVDGATTIDNNLVVNGTISQGTGNDLKFNAPGNGVLNENSGAISLSAGENSGSNGSITLDANGTGGSIRLEAGANTSTLNLADQSITANTSGVITLTATGANGGAFITLDPSLSQSSNLNGKSQDDQSLLIYTTASSGSAGDIDLISADDIEITAIDNISLDAADDIELYGDDVEVYALEDLEMLAMRLGGATNNIDTDEPLTTGYGGVLAIQGKDTNRYIADSNGKIVLLDASLPDSDWDGGVSGNYSAESIAAGTTGQFLVGDAQGNMRGLVIQENKTTLSGGQNAASLTLDTRGATFSNPTTGAPIQVHGVADGTADFDAVNVRQLYSGLAAVMAASTPELRLEPGKSSAAFGVGLYGGHSGVGFGVGHMFDNNTVLTFSAGKAAYSEPAYKASFSWTW